MDKKTCNICGVLTRDWMEVNYGAPICYECNSKLVIREHEARRANKQKREVPDGVRD